MKSWHKTNALVVLLVALGTSFGSTIGILATVALIGRSPNPPVIELPLYASASDTGDRYSMATAKINDNMEGLFVLNFRTGNLTMEVLSLRDGRVPAGQFITNVVKDLRIEDDRAASYLMVTAETTFVGGKVRDIEPGRSVVYVMDQNTGRWVAYGFRWNTTHGSRGDLQKGPLTALYAGTAQPVELQ